IDPGDRVDLVEPVRELSRGQAVGRRGLLQPGVGPEVEHRIDPGNPGDAVRMVGGPARDPEPAAAPPEQAWPGREAALSGQLMIEGGKLLATLGISERLADV